MKFYSTQQAADMLPVSINTLKKFIFDGFLKARRKDPRSKNSPRFILEQDLFEFAKENYDIDLSEVETPPQKPKTSSTTNAH